jgi:hypothetical protein
MTVAEYMSANRLAVVSATSVGGNWFVTVGDTHFDNSWDGQGPTPNDALDRALDAHEQA